MTICEGLDSIAGSRCPQALLKKQELPMEFGDLWVTLTCLPNCETMVTGPTLHLLPTALLLCPLHAERCLRLNIYSPLIHVLHPDSECDDIWKQGFRVIMQLR